MKRSIFNPVDTKKPFSKENFRTLMLISVFLYILCAFVCKNILVSAIIAVFATVVVIATYFINIAKKVVNENEILKYMGMQGMFNSFVFSLLAAYQRGETLINMLITFLILAAIILVIIGILELVSRFTAIWKKPSKASAVSAGIGAAAGLFGMTLSRHLRKIGMEIKPEFIIAMFAVVFAFFYSAFITRRNRISQSEYNDNQYTKDDG